MTMLTPYERGQVCDGWLVPPLLLDPTEKSPDTTDADYVCIRCLLTYYWRGKPPRLVCVRPI